MFKIILILSFALFTACRAPKIPYEPHVSYVPPATCLSHHTSPFPALTQQEVQIEWSKELKIGLAFAKEQDFYRAITAFKRALILSDGARRFELEYDIILSYYLAQKYTESITTFNESSLKHALSPSFPALHDLLIILYDSYLKTGDKECAEKLLPFLHGLYPKTEEKLILSETIQEGCFEQACRLPIAPPYLCSLYKCYQGELKSVQRAGTLNAVLPGAGYWYVGQKNTALTALIVNTLFIAAAYQFFHRGYIAAGAFTASLEMGWYLGGIYGASRAANEWNEAQYETYGRKALDQAGLYPVLMLGFTF